MKEASPLLTVIVAILIIIFCLIPIVLNLSVQEMKYKERNKNTEYRRSMKETGLESDE